MTRYSSIEEVNAVLIELEEHERTVSTDKAYGEKHSGIEKPPTRTSGSISVDGQNLVNGILEENGGGHEGIPDSDTNSESSTIDPEGHEEEEDLDEENHDDVGDSEDDYDDGEGIEDDDDEEVHFRQRVIEMDPLEEAEFEKELKALMQVRCWDLLFVTVLVAFSFACNYNIEGRQFQVCINLRGTDKCYDTLTCKFSYSIVYGPWRTFANFSSFRKCGES